MFDIRNEDSDSSDVNDFIDIHESTVSGRPEVIPTLKGKVDEKSEIVSKFEKIDESSILINQDLI